ncbi:MAG: DUF4112 domain-containing protein [Verrucomicrobia bacterium]|nr:DUF4112 domain-containing protein [Verrucomicrobiota bacterium]
MEEIAEALIGRHKDMWQCHSMELPANQPDPIRPTRIEYPLSPRLRRVRFLSNLLDQSIVLPGGYRIGLDPIIGLVPGIGDVVAAGFAAYIVYEGARMGIAKRVLLKMSGNVLIETLVGTIPLLGDIFDATWKANVRNAKLIEKHYNPAEPERSKRKVIGFVLFIFFGIAFLGLGLMALYIYMILQLLARITG